MSKAPWCVGPSGPDHARAVHEHRHGQVLERNLLEDLVVGPLQERAVDVDDRPQPAFGHARRHRDGVRFANPNVEEAVGNWSRIGSSMFPWHMAAVITTARDPSRRISASSVSRTTAV